MVALALLVNAAAVVVAFVAGLVIARGTRRQCIIVCAAGLTVCLAKGFLVRRPDVETRLFPWPNYVLFSGWNGPLAMLVLGTMVGLVRKRRDWAFIVIGGLVTMVYFGDYLRWVASAGGSLNVGSTEPVEVGIGAGGTDAQRGGPIRQTARPGYADTFVAQSTEYTCGAAAAATMLRYRGILTDEREMAALCLTREGRGTLDLGLYRGLNLKLEQAGSPERVRIVRLTFEELLGTRLPAILRVRFRADHMVVATDVRGKRVIVFNPASPGALLAWDQMALEETADWTGYAFVFTHPDGVRSPADHARPRITLEPPWTRHDRDEPLGP